MERSVWTGRQCESTVSEWEAIEESILSNYYRSHPTQRSGSYESRAVLRSALGKTLQRELRNYVRRNFAPGQAALRSICERHSRVEVCARYWAEGEYQCNERGPVASVLASNAMATLTPDSRSPMMPEPTTAMSNIAVPTASPAIRRDKSLLTAGHLPPQKHSTLLTELWPP